MRCRVRKFGLTAMMAAAMALAGIGPALHFAVAHSHAADAPHAHSHTHHHHGEAGYRDADPPASPDTPQPDPSDCPTCRMISQIIGATPPATGGLIACLDPRGDLPATDQNPHHLDSAAAVLSRGPPQRRA